MGSFFTASLFDRVSNIPFSVPNLHPGVGTSGVGITGVGTSGVGLLELGMSGVGADEVAIGEAVGGHSSSGTSSSLIVSLALNSGIGPWKKFLPVFCDI